MYGKNSSNVAEAPLIDSKRRLVTVSEPGGLGAAAIAGRLFFCATQGVVACSTTLNTTFTGLALGNPANSGKNYIVHRFSYSHTALIADETNLALATGVVSGLAAANTVKPALCLGTGTSDALVDEAATIIAPVVAMQITSLDDMLAGVQWASAPQVVDIGGAICLAPGAAVFTDSTYAIGAVMHFGFVWEELDV
ncbi:hypothetical protein H8E88_19230 [candidate division KSB1 bacterium]|nr:hypothetical protein [candidate division KSB1 bacterium]